jgi:phosphopantetheinyl transferase
MVECSECVLIILQRGEEVAVDIDVVVKQFNSHALRKVDAFRQEDDAAATLSNLPDETVGTDDFVGGRFGRVRG